MSKDRTAEALAVLGAAVGMLALVAVMVIWRGFALSILWGWFAVPAFGLPALSIPFAIGLALIVGYLSKDANIKKEEKSFGTLVADAFFTPVRALLVGWIVTLFI